MQSKQKGLKKKSLKLKTNWDALVISIYLDTFLLAIDADISLYFAVFVDKVFKLYKSMNVPWILPNV